MQRTSTSHAKIGTTIRTGSRRVKLRHRRDTKPEGRTQSLAPSGLLLHNPLRNQEELRHLRQRITCSSKVTSSLEDVPGWSTPPSHHPHRSFQFAVLEGTKENQPKNSPRIPGATRIQLRTQTCSRKQKHEGRLLRSGHLFPFLTYPTHYVTRAGTPMTHTFHIDSDS